MRVFSYLACMALVVLMVGCEVPKSNKTSGATMFSNRTLNVSGTIAVRQKLMMPPDTKAVVTLYDQDETNPDKRTLNTMVFPMGQSNPYPFTITYNEGLLLTDHKYMLEIRVTVNGETRFKTSPPLEVISNGKWDVGDVVLQTGSN